MRGRATDEDCSVCASHRQAAVGTPAHVENARNLQRRTLLPVSRQTWVRSEG